jgi:hypothetical protein
VDLEPLRAGAAAAVDEHDATARPVQRGHVLEGRVVAAQGAAADLDYDGLLAHGTHSKVKRGVRALEGSKRMRRLHPRPTRREEGGSRRARA